MLPKEYVLVVHVVRVPSLDLWHMSVLIALRVDMKNGGLSVSESAFWEYSAPSICVFVCSICLDCDKIISS